MREVFYTNSTHLVLLEGNARKCEGQRESFVSMFRPCKHSNSILCGRKGGQDGRRAGGRGGGGGRGGRVGGEEGEGGGGGGREERGGQAAVRWASRDTT